MRRPTATSPAGAVRLPGRRPTRSPRPTSTPASSRTWPSATATSRRPGDLGHRHGDRAPGRPGGHRPRQDRHLRGRQRRRRARTPATASATPSRVTNTGNVTLSDVTLTDPLVDDLRRPARQRSTPTRLERTRPPSAPATRSPRPTSTPAASATRRPRAAPSRRTAVHRRRQRRCSTSPRPRRSTSSRPAPTRTRTATASQNAGDRISYSLHGDQHRQRHAHRRDASPTRWSRSAAARSRASPRAAADATTFSAIYTVTQADIDAGCVTTRRPPTPPSRAPSTRRRQPRRPGPGARPSTSPRAAPSRTRTATASPNRATASATPSRQQHRQRHAHRRDRQRPAGHRPAAARSRARPSRPAARRPAAPPTPSPRPTSTPAACTTSATAPHSTESGPDERRPRRSRWPRAPPSPGQDRRPAAPTRRSATRSRTATGDQHRQRHDGRAVHRERRQAGRRHRRALRRSSPRRQLHGQRRHHDHPGRPGRGQAHERRLCARLQGERGRRLEQRHRDRLEVVPPSVASTSGWRIGQPGVVPVGGRVAYDIVVTNTGASTVGVVPLGDTYDAGQLTLVSASPTPTDVDPGTVAGTTSPPRSATSRPGAASPCDLEFRVDAAVTELTNTATAESCTTLEGVVGPGATDAQVIATFDPATSRSQRRPTRAPARSCLPGDTISTRSRW